MLKYEILWTLHTVTNHLSYNSANKSSALFPVMFPDSPKANKFICASTKSAYLATFGLAPYFQQLLTEQLKEVPFYSLAFDESFNHITKKSQMDFNVRFWVASKNKIVGRYLFSSFLGHATAENLLNEFKVGTSMLDMSKLIQVSMDGPNVNHKNLEKLITERSDLYPQFNDLIDIGSCSLHVMHGGFKTAFQATGWAIEKILRSLWYLFKESPARREDFTTITGSTKFPLQFCGTRWVEDVRVAERAVSLWPFIEKYVSITSKWPKAKVPQCSSYKEVSAAVKDKLILVKFSFFITVAKLIQPFLVIFQSEKPMVPFLGQEIAKLLKAMMENFMKKDSLPENISLSSLLKVDVKSRSHHLSIEKVFIGFNTKCILSEVEISDEQKVLFKEECVRCYTTLINKIKERSPLKFEFVRQLSCLCPNYMVQHPNSTIAKFEKVLTLMMSKKYLNGDECDELRKQFKCFVRSLKYERCEMFRQFNLHTSSLDDLFYTTVGSNEEYKKL